MEGPSATSQLLLGIQGYEVQNGGHGSTNSGGALSKSAIFAVTGEEAVEVSKLLQNSALASSLVSAACMRVFQGDKDLRSTARALDYFAYGLELLKLAPRITDAVIRLIGEREAGDIGEEAADVA